MFQTLFRRKFLGDRTKDEHHFEDLIIRDLAHPDPPLLACVPNLLHLEDPNPNRAPPPIRPERPANGPR